MRKNENKVKISHGSYWKRKRKGDNVIKLYNNKPAAQAADADPSQCKSTSRQNPPIKQYCRNFLNQFTDFDVLEDLKSLKNINIVCI